jgi:predicted dehydrogenase
MAKKTRWGILGLGRISATFAEALAVIPEAEVTAVGSRSLETAQAFATKYKAKRAHPTYEALAKDPEVEVIYIGTPHPLHCENTLLCLEAGKAVLCEKPFAIHEREARRMVETAHRAKRFLMEAMWTHFLPSVLKLEELVAQGAIGEPRLLQADFGFRAPFDPKGRLFDPALGGGSLLDVGIYPLALATRLFGEPVKVQSGAVLGQTGVDEQASFLLDYSRGRQAILASAVRTETSQSATLYGTEGSLRIPRPWWKGQELVLVRPGRDEERLQLPFEGNGYPHQAREVMRCLSEGRQESPRMSHDFSLLVMRTMDRIRAPWGPMYAADSK